MGRLTDRTVRTAPPGRHGDDAVRGLMLVVQAGGSRSWVLRYQMAGWRRDMGLGPYPEIGLARARERAMEARRLAKRLYEVTADQGFAADPGLRDDLPGLARARPLQPGLLLRVEDDRGRHEEVARGGLHPRVAGEDSDERGHKEARRREVGAVWHSPRLARARTPA